ncbi:MAG: hypothetical protein J5651_00305 [Salinivirgaceae bacterium]|nr:hypothetical protein [Salinivirgaceae bacterium]
MESAKELQDKIMQLIDAGQRLRKVVANNDKYVYKAFGQLQGKCFVCKTHGDIIVAKVLKIHTNHTFTGSEVIIGIDESDNEMPFLRLWYNTRNYLHPSDIKALTVISEDDFTRVYTAAARLQDDFTKQMDELKAIVGCVTGEINPDKK